MIVKNRILKNTLTFYFNGELDEHAAKMWRDKLDEIIEETQNVDKIVYDLTNLTFMDSTGIGVLIGRYKKAKSRNIASYIKNNSTAIEKIIKLSGLYSIMPNVS